MKKDKKVIKKEKKHVIFDEKERTEFLTGFRKRKMARKLKAKEKLDNLLKEEKRKIKQNQREALKEAISSQRQVPEIEHLLKPVTYDLPDHTVTISEFEDFGSVPVTSSLHTTQEDVPSKLKKVDEVEKIRKLIKDLKSKRIKTLKTSSAQISAKRRQKKLDRNKAKRTQKLMEKKKKKHTKKKHKKKGGK